MLAWLRVHTQNDLLVATKKNLEKIKVRVQTAKLLGKDKIGVAAGNVVNQYKVAKRLCETPVAPPVVRPRHPLSRSQQRPITYKNANSN